MSRDHDCATCRDRGLIAPRWQDDTDRMVLCPARCIAAEERAQQESDDSNSPDYTRLSNRGTHTIPGWFIRRNGFAIGFIELMPSGRWQAYAYHAGSGDNSAVSAQEATANVWSWTLGRAS